MSYSQGFYEKIKSAVDIDEKKFEEIKQGAVLFFKQKECDSENVMDYMVKYVQANHPELSGKTVRIGSRNNETSFSVGLGNMYATKPIEEILCEVIQEKK